MSIISFYDYYKRTTCLLSTRLLCCYFIDSLVNERTDVKRSRSRDRVRVYASQSRKMAMIPMLIFQLFDEIRLGREHDLRWKTRKHFRSRQGSFSRMISALAHELVSVWTRKGESWTKHRTRGFSYLKVNNWRSTITATFLPLTWQFYANFIATWRYQGGDIGGAL